MDKTEVQTLTERLGRLERKLTILYILAFVAFIGVVATATVWLTRGSGRSEVSDRYECRREVAMMRYGSGHSEFEKNLEGVHGSEGLRRRPESGAVILLLHGRLIEALGHPLTVGFVSDLFADLG